MLRPAVLLLDEPLSALDAKLRRQLQVELKALQERVGITFLFVTHDQEEALTMSDRLAVMQDGRIAQIGTPREVYEEPATAYVADFLGVSNLLEATVVEAGAGSRCCVLRIGEFTVRAACGDVGAAGRVKLAVRPERVELRDYADERDDDVPGMVERTVFRGPATQVHVRLATGDAVQVLLPNGGGQPTWAPGSPVRVGLVPQALRVLADPVPAVGAVAEPTAAASDATPAPAG